MTIEGVLPVWKPAGFTSHDVVAKARRILGTKRIGHTGTLDPMVTGVLPLCVGRATRMVEYIQELSKEYSATLVIGYSTDTEDQTGAVIDRVDRVSLKEEEVRSAVSSFLGEIDQIPPMYSAVKVGGKRLYELARQGETVERKSRRVTIHEIEITSLNLELPHPEIGLRVRCSKGTYIRTLCADIGQSLGYPAVMGKLVRTATGGITAEQCLTLEEIADLFQKGELGSRMIPSDEAVSFLPSASVNVQQAQYALQGKFVQLQQPIPTLEGSLIRIYDPDSIFLGLYRVKAGGRTASPEKVFLP